MTARPPAPLPGDVRAMLAAYRDAHELPDAVRDRIWSVVGADDAPAPVFDPGRVEAAADVHPGSARSAKVRWLAWGVATLVVAAVLVLAWQLRGLLAERRHVSRAPDAAIMQGSEASPGRATPRDEGAPIVVPTAPSPTTTAASAAPPPTPVEPATLPSRSRTPPSTGATTRPRRPHHEPSEPDVGDVAPGSSLAAERELVARAWRALALGEIAGALELAAAHERRFPAGLLAPERAAIDTIARCRRGDSDGPRHATAFHRAHPRSPLAGRVDEACVAAPSKGSPP
jgi:hypothetical protein